MAILDRVSCVVRPFTSKERDCTHTSCLQCLVLSTIYNFFTHATTEHAECVSTFTRYRKANSQEFDSDQEIKQTFPRLWPLTAQTLAMLVLKGTLFVQM